jgi:twitching motility two-component system response regulator PilH
MATILIVDDTASELALMRVVVERLGDVAVVASNGIEAVRLAREHQPSLILLDIVMPEQDGFVTCRQLRKVPETAAIPVVHVSSKSTESDKFWGLKQGAVAYITKPFEPAQLAHAISEHLRGYTNFPLQPRNFTLAMAHILIVDDNPSETALMAKVVKDLGHTYDAVTDGELGLQKAAAVHPDLILLDVVMPNLDGFNTCRKLKKVPETASIPVVIVSSKSGESDQFWAQRQGANGYVVKPFSAELLAEAIRSFVK